MDKFIGFIIVLVVGYYAIVFWYITLPILMLLGLLERFVLKPDREMKEQMAKDKALKAKVARQQRKLEALEALDGMSLVLPTVEHPARTLALRYGIDAGLQGNALEVTVTKVLTVDEDAAIVLAKTTAWGMVKVVISYSDKDGYFAKTYLPMTKTYFTKFKLLDAHLKDKQISLRRLVEIHHQEIRGKR